MVADAPVAVVAVVALLTPAEIEDHVRHDVGCTADDRDPLDALALRLAPRAAARAVA